MGAETIIVTRHQGLADLVRELELVPEDTPWVPDPSPDDLRGRHVIGTLPLWLAAHAASYTAVRVALPREVGKGDELTVEQLRPLYRGVERYVIRRISENGSGEVAS